MTDIYTVTERAIGPVIEIEEHAPVWRMPGVFGRDYPRIADYIHSQNAEIVGMPYARYVDMNWEAELNRGKVSAFISMFTRKWHFFVGMPTSKLLPTQGLLVSKELASRRYAQAIHRGPYQDSSKTYAALNDWAIANGLQMTNEAFEFYLNDPREVGQEAAETEILIPLK